MDALRALLNLAVMAVVSVVGAAIWQAYNPDTQVGFGTIWFVSFLCVWGAVYVMNGGGSSKKHRH